MLLKPHEYLLSRMLQPFAFHSSLSIVATPGNRNLKRHIHNMALPIKALSWMAFLVATTLTAAGSSTRPPSFLIFLADDLGYGDISYYGSPTISTPNIDKLIREGKDFRQFYAAASVCTPSRAGLMTGRDAVRSGIYATIMERDLRVFFPWSTGSLPNNESTLPRMLKKAGYISSYIGKWHLGHVDALPTQRGFDSFFGIPYSNDMSSHHYHVEELPLANRIVPPLPVINDTTIVEQPADFDTLTDRFTDAAIDFLHHHRNTPFLQIVSYYQPHVPQNPAPRFRNSSLRGSFGDSVNEIDDSVGRIMTALTAAGLDEETLVLFTSDNGPWTMAGIEGGSSGGFRGSKGTTWEGGLRVPAIARWKSVIEPASRSYHMISLLDIYNTLAQLAGLPIERTDAVGTDSYSFAHILKPHQFAKDVDRKAVHFFYQSHLMAVRMGAFKMHKYTRCAYCSEEPIPHDPPLLFNVEKDPFETYPLNVTEYPHILQQLEEEYCRYNSSLAPLPPQFNEMGLMAAPCCMGLPWFHPCECNTAPYNSDNTNPRLEHLVESSTSTAYSNPALAPTVVQETLTKFEHSRFLPILQKLLDDAHVGV
eukprot:m.116393 g.116393  ORF g.116393 m.116393 type:complete len:592 (+) comp15399_c0_seq1:269-2044(+)